LSADRALPRTERGRPAGPQRGQSDSLTLEDVIRHNIRRLRVSRSWSQDQLASEIQRNGLASWARPQVAATESGARGLSIGEVLVIARTFAVGWDDLSAVQELTPGGAEDVHIAVTPTLGVGGTHLPELCRLQPEAVAQLITTGEGEALVQALESGATRQAEQKIARALGVSTDVLTMAAKRLWGRGLTEERDRRADAGAAASTRERQALRAHATRLLIAELAHELGVGGSSTPY
jgi:hypothetical protein